MTKISFYDKRPTILITGGTGMVGQAIMRNLPLNCSIAAVGSKDYDLTDYIATLKMFHEIRPTKVIHLAARVGGVKSNTDFIADYFRENMLINTNVLSVAYRYKVEKLVSLLSTCVYPDEKWAKYPLTEDQLHVGPPHDSNFGYAYAKRMVDVQSRAYRQQHGCNFVTAIPNNLFGTNDMFDLENSHVIPALIRKIYEAKLCKEASFEVWGDGSPLREFTCSDDIAKILLFLLENYNEQEPINIGNTNETSIKEVVTTICQLFEYDGEIIWNTNKPSGQHRKPSSNKKLLSIGWKEEYYTPFFDSLKKTCEWFKRSYPNVRGIK